MNREECIEVVNKQGWDFLVFNHSGEIEEDFWEEFIGEINIEMLLQRTRMSNEFMDSFKSFMGDDVHKKYKSIYCLCELSEGDDKVYSDIAKTYLSHLRNKKDINYILKDFEQNSDVYEHAVNVLMSEYVRKHYDDLGNKSLSKKLINKIASSYLKVHKFYRDYGMTEPDEIKKFFKKMKKKGDIYSVNVLTSEFADFQEFDRMAVIVSLEVVEGIGPIVLSFLAQSGNPFNFSV